MFHGTFKQPQANLLLCRPHEFKVTIDHPLVTCQTPVELLVDLLLSGDSWLRGGRQHSAFEDASSLGAKLAALLKALQMHQGKKVRWLSASHIEFTMLGAFASQERAPYMSQVPDRASLDCRKSCESSAMISTTFGTSRKFSREKKQRCR